MTADAICATCGGFLVWWDAEGWVHRNDPADFHDAKPDQLVKKEDAHG